MARYRVVHMYTGEIWEVDVKSANEARQVVGWSSEVCAVTLVTDGPFAEITPPKIATQTSPPLKGSSHICPVCKVSMVEAPDKGELWWHCPSCDLLYQEWENRFYSLDDL